MALIIGTVLALVFLEWPWQLLVIAPLAVIEVLEIRLWLSLRKMPSITGAAGMIGTRGVAITNLSPEGQVKVKGRIWKARSGNDVLAGEEIIVSAVDGLVLEVDRPEGRSQAAAPGVRTASR